MGTTGAYAMAAVALEGYTDKTGALLWHLQSNHYPPIPGVMVCPALEAIGWAIVGEPEQEVELPEGITCRDYGESCPSSFLIEALHLEAFVEVWGCAEDTLEFVTSAPEFTGDDEDEALVAISEYQMELLDAMEGDEDV